MRDKTRYAKGANDQFKWVSEQFEKYRKRKVKTPQGAKIAAELAFNKLDGQIRRYKKLNLRDPDNEKKFVKSLTDKAKARDELIKALQHIVPRQRCRDH